MIVLGVLVMLISIAIMIWILIRPLWEVIEFERQRNNRKS